MNPYPPLPPIPPPTPDQAEAQDHYRNATVALAQLERTAPPKAITHKALLQRVRIGLDRLARAHAAELASHFTNARIVLEDHARAIRKAAGDQMRLRHQREMHHAQRRFDDLHSEWGKALQRENTERLEKRRLAEQLRLRTYQLARERGEPLNVRELEWLEGMEKAEAEEQAARDAARAYAADMARTDGDTAPPAEPIF